MCSGFTRNQPSQTPGFGVRIMKIFYVGGSKPGFGSFFLVPNFGVWRLQIWGLGAPFFAHFFRFGGANFEVFVPVWRCSFLWVWRLCVLCLLGAACSSGVESGGWLQPLWLGVGELQCVGDSVRGSRLGVAA